MDDKEKVKILVAKLQDIQDTLDRESSKLTHSPSSFPGEWIHIVAKIVHGITECLDKMSKPRFIARGCDVFYQDDLGSLLIAHFSDYYGLHNGSERATEYVEFLNAKHTNINGAELSDI